ncbi:MAG: hypothetical protein A3D35_01490 [Candidatus Staskawiczbacteria bacterium RIFCSPHIGHO2_02_FULL_34_9]|uniref:Uncharacterized protein n=1 Tax=Candidatus Staskawiczbacteria bacterium RIFCSPHIGHO2_02_FULL_34_9 TaxID=1802206 RepID=A0A1G2HZP8_9BACT|nr:MAG: hypothetical protein A3D35_01490 [Candidatus Staskawiczbacteria bacterium RIFCSPHIGHO2_02_FULL_34_9]
MLDLEEIERILNPGKYRGSLELLPGESELPLCLQAPFWTEFAENFGEARRLGFEVVDLMDEIATLQKEGKSIPDDFDQRWKEAVEKMKGAFEKCQGKATIIWKEANK